MRWSVLVFALGLTVTQAFAQTVSQWRTSGGLPLVIVQIPGGDIEHLAAVLPPDVTAIERVGDEPVQVSGRRLAQVITVRATELRLAAVTRDLIQGLRETGAAVLVAMGPRPVRDLEALFNTAEDIPWRPLPRQRCPALDGGVEAHSGSPERIELALTLPDPADPRLALAPSLALWIEHALRGRVPGLRTEVDLGAGCARLLLRAPADGLPPREVVRTVRGELASLAMRAPTETEMAAIRAASASRAGRAAVQTEAVVRELAEWVALGASPASALAIGEVDGPALAALTRDVLTGHSGWAIVVEAERRGRPPDHESIENGSLLSVSWVAGDLAVVGLALGGFEPRIGAAILDQTAGAASRQGWSSHRSELLGVPVLAVAVPAELANDALELVTSTLQPSSSTFSEGPWKDAVLALGLADQPTAEVVSLAAALPLDAEEGAEAARKFLAGIPTGGVRVGAHGSDRRLEWTVSESAPGIVAVAELEGSAAGVLAAFALQSRAAAAQIELHVLAPSGRLVVAVVASGEADVPALDRRLEQTWRLLLRPVEKAELPAIQSRASAALLGDFAHAVARQAAHPFLPSTLGESAWRSLSAAEVSKVLAGLGAWNELRRFAHGPAPAPDRGVRQSGAGAPPRR